MIKAEKIRLIAKGVYQTLRKGSGSMKRKYRPARIPSGGIAKVAQSQGEGKERSDMSGIFGV